MAFLLSLFPFLFVGTIIFLAFRSIVKQTKKVRENIKKMLETFNDFSPELKDDFYSQLKGNQRENFERLLQAFLHGKPIRVLRIKAIESQSLQLLYRWMIKKNLETNFKVYSALKEEHRNSIKSKIKPKSRELFERVFELYNVAGEVPFKNIGRILKYGFLADFITNMEGYRNKFMDLNGHVQNIFSNHIGTMMDEHLISNMNEMNAFNDFENMQLAMQQEFHTIMDQQFQQFSLEEAWRSVTPFDHGGYVMGPGFNPSDTMAFDAQQDMMNQMDIMNQMNDMMSQMDMMNQMNDMMNDFGQMNDMMSSMDSMNDMNHHDHF